MTYRVRNLAIALGLALFAVLIVSVYVSQVKRDVSSGNKPVTVYVAKTDISAGTPGEEVAHLLTPMTVPRRNVVPGAISDPKEIADGVTSQQIYQGEQVTDRRFSTSAAGGIRGEITGNQRIIEVVGKPQQVLAGTLKDGDHVDIVATWNAVENGEHHVSRVLLRNLLVVNAPTSPAGTTGVSSSANEDTPVQLRMTDLQAHEFFWMVENGAWSLVLRPPVQSANSPDNIQDGASIALGGLAKGANLKILGGNR
jgi:Flp pilus assembly protein CpaB